MIHILSLFVFSFLLSTVEGARLGKPASFSVSEFFCTTDSCEGWQLAATISTILFVVLTWCGTFRCCPLYDRLQQIAKTIASILFFVLSCCLCCGTCNSLEDQWRPVQVVMVEGRPYYIITAEEEERQRRTEKQELRMTETV